MSEDIAFIKTVSAPESLKLYRVGSDCKGKRKKGKRCHNRGIHRCDKGDIVVDSGECSDGSQFLICAESTENACPVIGGVEGTMTGVNIADNGTPSVVCSYSSDVFESETVVEDYEIAFGADEDFPVVLQEGCFKTTENCPTDPLTGKKMPLCSVYVSPTTSGDLCKQQALLPGNQVTFERMAENYCSTNSTPDCRCIDRTDVQIYDALRTRDASEDGCWWKWCADTTNFIVPPNVVLGIDPTTCPDVLKKIGSEINENAEDLECCQIQQNVIYAPDGTTVLPVNCFFADAVAIRTSWFQQYGWWILIIIVVFIVLIVIVAIWASHAYHTERYV